MGAATPRLHMTGKRRAGMRAKGRDLTHGTVSTRASPANGEQGPGMFAFRLHLLQSMGGAHDQRGRART